MKKYRDWRRGLKEATGDPVRKDDDDQATPNDDDKLFYKGQYSGVVGPLLSRLSGAVLSDARFNRPSVKGLLLQDIILALGLNHDVSTFWRIAYRIANEINSSQNPATLAYSSPTLRKAIDRKGLTPMDLDKGKPAPPPPQDAPPTLEK